MKFRDIFTKPEEVLADSVKQSDTFREDCVTLDLYKSIWIKQSHNNHISSLINYYTET